MAALPDPTANLNPADLQRLGEMAAARAHAEGKPQLGQVYVRMFNNPGVAAKVGELGEQLRFHGILPAEVRELAILRFAARQGIGYAWSHHQHPAQQAGISTAVVAAVSRGEVPAELSSPVQAALRAVDAVQAGNSIPAATQEVLVTAYGTAGAVELVALCGLYALIGYMVAGFDVALEAGFPPAPF